MDAATTTSGAVPSAPRGADAARPGSAARRATASAWRDERRPRGVDGLNGFEEAVLGTRLDMLRQYPVVERLDLLEDLDVIRQLDGLEGRREG